jgi:hypothetical protein
MSFQRVLVLVLFLGDALAWAQKIDVEGDTDSSRDIEENSSELLSAASLAREVVQASQSLHAFDWRKMSSEVSFGYGYADEANNFDTESFNLGLGIPARDGYLIQGGLRRTLVYSTPSTNQLGATPYLQEGLTSRYELYGGLAVSLLEGRAMSRLSPWLADLEFVWFGIGRLHYSRSTQDWQPWSSRKPPSKLGQKPISSMLGAELGFRTQVYLPIHIGLYFEWLYIRPRSGGLDLKSWRYFEGGLTWEIP